MKMNRKQNILSIALLMGVATSSYAQTIKGKIYGGGEISAVDGNAKVEVKTGKVGETGTKDGGVFGGGLGQQTVVKGNVDVVIGADKKSNQPIINGDVYGGSALGTTNSTAVKIKDGSVNGVVYGGGLGDATAAANVGSVRVTMQGGKVETLYGCNNVNGSPQDSVYIDIIGGIVTGDVYGGGNVAAYAGNPYLSIVGGKVQNNVYGGGNLAEVGATHVLISDSALVQNNVYGGGKMANVADTTHVLMQGGRANKLFGGNDISGQIANGTHVYIQNAKLLDAALLTNLMKKDSVYLVRPQIGEVYAGGDGAQSAANGKAVPDVNNATLRILGGAIGNAYGGGNNATVTDYTRIYVNTDNRVFMQDSVYDADRLFGGNNLAPMAIQPTWDLVSGHIGSVYSGGNKGMMTYYNASPDYTIGEVKGLRIDVKSPNMYIERLFGGCRMSDVVAMQGGSPVVMNDADDTADRYGANVFVSAGHIESVYGGNDVSGAVNNGTHLEIRGAISGDIYGGGNGNYIYQYDGHAGANDINEVVDPDLDYFVVQSTDAATADPLKKLCIINRFRPNVARAFLDIQGSATEPVFIKGNVYAGGNSASVNNTADGNNVDVRFEIGSHVIINGVYMGCNGENLTDSIYLNNLFDKNGIAFNSSNGKALLDSVMKAVEMNALPKGFDDFGNKTIENAHIGSFFMGGNAGSLTTAKHINMGFPKGLDIYDHIVGGCNNTDFTYCGVKHQGGLMTPLADPTDPVKLTLDVSSTFTPRYIKLLTNAYGYEDNAELVYLLGTTDKGKIVFNERRCNVFGGCYTSGTTVGDVEINIKTDMLDHFVGKNIVWEGATYKGDDILYNTNYQKYTAAKSSAHVPYVFSVFGGGYGQNTHLLGNVHISMPYHREGGTLTFPRVNTIYGGSEQGRVVGNVLIEVRNGEVYNSIFGGSDAAKLYGSTQTIVGYPEYYTSKENYDYELVRSDQSEDNLARISPERPNVKVVKTDAKYQAGEIMPCNVKEIIKPAELSKISAKIDDKSIMGGSWDNDVKILIRSGIYGGGYSASYSHEESAGTFTICSFDNDNKLNDASVGYGGNATIIVADDPDKEHIIISTPPKGVSALSKNIGGDGGIFGCGHLTFTEGFRSVDISNYGYAEHTVDNPLTLNTFQRIDLLTLRDCCMKIWGSRDFATNSIDATVYSIARVHEVNMQSSIDANTNLKDYDQVKSRNFIGFMNNMHYFGSLVTNDPFENGVYHDSTGVVISGKEYMAEKIDYINNYRIGDTEEKVALFKKRNIGTARNLIGINNGYCLKIQNACQDSIWNTATNQWDYVKPYYYGPIVGVAEVKLLSFMPGEGGGYVYADNLHDYSSTVDDDRYLQRRGNFVFPGAQGETAGARQYIVDDCFPKNYQETQNHSNESEAHYWYVQGTKYFFNTVLTGFTCNKKMEFRLNNEDGIVQLSGLQTGNELALESVAWRSDTDEPGVYSSDMKNGSKQYRFDIEVGDRKDALHTIIDSIARNGLNNISFAAPDTIVGRPASAITLSGVGSTLVANGATDSIYTYRSTSLPVFDLHLIDSEDNYGEDYYNEHMYKPEEVLLVMKAIDDQGQLCTYYITAIVQYLQGPYVKGEMDIKNCALPGEQIHVDANFVISSDNNIVISNKEWKVLRPLGGNKYETAEDGMKLEKEYIHYIDNENCYIEIPAYLYENGYKLAYTFKAVGQDFGFVSELSSDNQLEVHNYHRMKKAIDLQVDSCAGARVYIKDAEDLAAFQAWVNGGHRTDSVDFILQDNLMLPDGWTLNKDFKGTLHGDGYTLTSFNNASLFGSHLVIDTIAQVYNLGMIGGTISNKITDRPDAHGLVNGTHVANSFEAQDNADFLYGSNAYQLSHHFKPTTNGYVERYFANGDYQYATCDTIWSLRTAEEPNYGKSKTHHDMTHKHDSLRWDNALSINVPLYDGSADSYNNDYLFFGQNLGLGTDRDSIPSHISRATDNRVYQTAGYYQYQDKALDKFHYNPKAYALQPTMTAVNFVAGVRTPEADNASSKPVSFAVDSNADHGTDYDNEENDYITQNLLVYHDAADATIFGTEADSTLEKDVRYHSIAKTGDSYATDYFHLVDKQDYDAPIAFTVNSRAWYERMPELYRNIGQRAWEGICLPFTVTRVVADANGEISHFYKDSDKNHEYWLRGMTAVAADKATFAEVGTFVDTDQQTMAYTYRNSYFANLAGYSTAENFGAHYKTAATTGVEYAGYVPQAGGVPYLVAFPGNDYYEFSMEGTDYDRTTHDKTGMAQGVTMENRGGVQIKASSADKRLTTVGSVAHQGAYLHGATSYVMDSDGNGFEKVTSGEVLPFRTSLSISGGAAPVRFAIVGIQDPIEEIEDEDPISELEIYVKGMTVYVSSPFESNLRIPVYMSSGHLVTIHTATPGLSSFQLNHAGVYMIGGNKILVK